jgi:hypothetical protein
MARRVSQSVRDLREHLVELAARSPRRSDMRVLRVALGILTISWTIGVSDAAAKSLKMLDECDPDTFNAIGLGVICDVNFNGGVTFPEFAALLSPSAFGHPAWRFDAPYLEI